MIHDETVRRRQWLDDQRFLDLVGATNLIPGPNSTEMAIHIGFLRAGWRGLLVAGASFIVPAVCIVTALAWGYVRVGSARSSTDSSTGSSRWSSRSSRRRSGFSGGRR